MASENGSDPDKKKSKSIEHVVDELRNVLSGLQPSSSAQPAPLSDNMPEPEVGLPRASVPAPIEPPPLTRIELPSSDPKESNGPLMGAEMPSDQDFWNGNVLGWPSQEEKPIEEDGAREPGEEPEVDKSSLADMGSIPMVDRMWLDQSAKEPLPQVFPATPDVPRSPDAEELKTGVDPFGFPPRPLSPDEVEPDALSPDITPMERKEIAAQLEDSPPEPSRVVLPENLKVPIPETLHQIPDSPGKTARADERGSIEVHPRSILQAACVFPSGQEEVVSGFISRLEAAVKQLPDLSGVHVASMVAMESAGRNFEAWKKAASLAGANMLFVFAAKKDRDQYKDISKLSHQDEIPARFVALEQIPLKTLYQDILADMKRRLPRV